MPGATVNKVGVASKFKLFHPNVLFCQGLEYLDIKGIILFFKLKCPSVATWVYSGFSGFLRAPKTRWVMDMCTAVHEAMSLGGVFPPHVWRSRDRLATSQIKSGIKH